MSTPTPSRRGGLGEGGRHLNGPRHPQRVFAGEAWKIGLAVRIWYSFLAVVVGLRRLPLPELVERLAPQRPRTMRPHEPAWLGEVVWRVLHLGRWRPRCLHSSLVLLRLLRLQGHAAELVIGLPQVPTSRDAHAWVEVAGLDVGPPPGRAGHVELARYR